MVEASQPFNDPSRKISDILENPFMHLNPDSLSKSDGVAVSAGSESPSAATVSLGALLEGLANHKFIASIWGLEDVQQSRPDLSDEQAWEVLKECDRRSDAETGLNTAFIESVAESLFPNTSSLQSTSPRMPEITGLDELRKEDRDAALAELKGAFRRTLLPVPEAEIALLLKTALGDTGQSRRCRYLLFSLVGMEDPTGYRGDGFLELRALDRDLSDALFRVVEWLRGPTQTDGPFYKALRVLENQFAEQHRGE